MKAICYFQVGAKHDRFGRMIGLRILHMTRKHPGETKGVHVVRLELEVPDSCFAPTTIKAVIPVERLSVSVNGSVSP